MQLPVRILLFPVAQSLIVTLDGEIKKLNPLYSTINEEIEYKPDGFIWKKETGDIPI
jgi:hypothetical protein